MKTTMIGIVAAAILMVVTGIGFGIAQAGGNNESDWVSVEALDSYFEYQPESQPVLSFEDSEATQVAKSPSEDMQLRDPVETGSMPSENNADSSIVEIDGIWYYQVKGKIDGSF